MLRLYRYFWSQLPKLQKSLILLESQEGIKSKAVNFAMSEPEALKLAGSTGDVSIMLEFHKITETHQWTKKEDLRDNIQAIAVTQIWTLLSFFQ